MFKKERCAQLAIAIATPLLKAASVALLHNDGEPACEWSD